MHAHAKKALKVAVSFGLVAWLLSRVPLGHLSSVLVGANMVWLVLAWGLYLLAQTLSAWRWMRIAQSLRVPAAWHTCVRGYFVAMFFSQTLPSGMGGDVYRVWLLRHGGPRLAALNSVLLDRLSGFGVLLVLALVGLGLGWGWVQHTPLAPVVGAVAVCALVGLPVLLRLTGWRVLYRKKPTRWLWCLARDARRAFFSGLPRFVEQAGMSLVIQVMTVLIFACVAQSIGAPGSVKIWLVLAPMVVFTYLVPFSVAGWGLREGALVGLAHLSGWLTPTQALATGLLVGIVTLATALPGAIWWLRAHRPKPQPVAR